MKKYLFFLLCTLCFINNTYPIDISRYQFHTIPATHYYHGIMGITKDSIGRIWYNGRDALFMYDGNSFNQMDKYVAELFPRTSWVYKTVFTDKDKKLFIVTDQGLLHFDYKTHQFNAIIDGDVNNSVAQEKDGLFWILRNNRIESFYYSENPRIQVHPSPDSKGLSGLSHINGYTYFAAGSNIYRITREMKTPELFSSLNENIRYMRQMIGYKDDFFVLVNPGLYRLDAAGNIKKEYKINNEVLSDLKHMYVDELGVLWVATQNGLLLINPENDEFVLLQSKPEDIYSIPHNSIWSVYPDPDGGVWIGTFGGKLAYLNFTESHITYKTQLHGQLNNSIVSCFEEDANGNIWIGTEGGGLNVWSRKSNTFRYYTHSDNKGINYDLIKALSFDSEKRKLRISAYNGGIVEYDTKTEKFKDLDFYDLNNYTQKMSVYDFVAEADSGIWIANPEETLYYKDLKTGKIKQIALININGTIMNDIAIECLYRDDKEKLWMFTHRGIFIMDVKSRKIESQHYVKDMPYSVNNLICYKHTSAGELYIGTMGGGINVLTKDGEYRNIGTEQGFFPNTVFAIEEDAGSQNIWFATDDGVYCYEKTTGKYTKVDIFDSDKYGSFYPKSSFRTSEGEIIFGGTKGFFIFKPEYIRQNKQKPVVFFTNFLINNNEIRPDISSVLDSDISVMNLAGNTVHNVITLSHRQSHIRIHFSSDSYLNSSKNRFAYKLKSRRNSEDWQILPPEQRFVQFSNLPPGTYTLEVKGANNDGVWGTRITSLSFKIKPAPWFSTWAIILYFILICSFFVIIYRLYSNKKNFQHRLKLEKMKEQKMNELIQLRVDFFTNISHDLKTPLTLILSPLHRLKTVVPDDESVMKYVNMIERNVTRIQRMISQLLQFREIESRKVTLNPQQGNLAKYILDIFALFVPYAEKKFIATSSSVSNENLIVNFDYDTIEKILFNLISNAIKYSPEGESVFLRINEASVEDIQLLEKKYQPESNMEYVSIDIVNTGVEISCEQQKKLFKSFSRLSDKIPVFENSTGLGLSIVKELVETLKGMVILESENKKVSFRIIIPFSKVRHTTIPVKQFSYEYTLSELRNMDVDIESTEKSAKNRKKAYDVVVVEDNSDLRDYMKKELSEYFNIYIAPDGEEGAHLVHRINPQVVVTDLMMPRLDGFELSKILKSDIKTSHIPIIIISALGDNPKHKVRSLKDGADIFIEKPFDISFLKEQIFNLIKSREMLKEKYSKKIVAEPSRITFSSIDEELLKKAIIAIEKNIDNSEYNVESFVSDMGGSRTLLYRKINEITGMSIKEFILDMRLKRSAQLLTDSRLTVSEIAYQAGFNDAGYFSVCFKKHYGVSPSEFKKKEEK